jgi:hypothetical protein
MSSRLCSRRKDKAHEHANVDYLTKVEFLLRDAQRVVVPEPWAMHFRLKSNFTRSFELIVNGMAPINFQGPCSTRHIHSREPFKTFHTLWLFGTAKILFRQLQLYTHFIRVAG